MYFAIGGRKTQSALYRVTYTGAEPVTPAAAVQPRAEALLRRQLEALHNAEAGPKAVELAWPHLAHPDRFVRFAAPVAIEHRPVQSGAVARLRKRILSLRWKR